MNKNKIITFILLVGVLLFASLSVVEAKKISNKKVPIQKSMTTSVDGPEMLPLPGTYFTVRTVPVNTAVVADGKTEYRVDVLIDTLSHAPGIRFNSAEWKLVVPSYVTITRSEWSSQPSNPSDFFYGFGMRLDGTCKGVGSVVVGGKISNCRDVIATDGPSNKTNSILGIYYFTINPNATLGSDTFGLYNFYAYAVNEIPGGSGIEYSCPLNYSGPASGCVKEYVPFTVSPVVGDANHDGTVDLQDFSLLKANYGCGDPVPEICTWEQGNFNGDSVIDLQDFSLLKANYGY